VEQPLLVQSKTETNPKWRGTWVGMYGVLPTDNVPVLYEADAVVVGGSLSGIACAVRLARHRLKTVVIEPRTYLGRELTAALRPWIDLQDTERDSLPELIRYCLEHSGAAGGELVISGSVPLHPDRLKISLENLLADHGVDLIYASLPIGFVGQAGSIDGLVIANKSGRQGDFVPLRDRRDGNRRLRPAVRGGRVPLQLGEFRVVFPDAGVYGC